MIDAFVRVYAPNELRLGLAIATVARMKLQKDVRVTVVQCEKSISSGYRWHVKTVNVPDAPFAMASVQVIETLAQSPIYFATDDDCLIYGQDFVSKGLALMERFPEFGYISASPVNESGLKIPDPIPEVVEMHAVGGPGFTRKGIVTDFRSTENQYISMELHRQMVEKGFKQGYARDLKYLHMGSKFSISSPLHWTGA